MIASAFLSELERAGVTLRRDGEHLRVRAAPGACIERYRARIATLKPALLAALDWHAEVIRTKGFDRARADWLYARLRAQEVAPGDRAPPAAGKTTAKAM